MAELHLVTPEYASPRVLPGGVNYSEIGTDPTVFNGSSRQLRVIEIYLTPAINSRR
jgi:hypothetical protein